MHKQNEHRNRKEEAASIEGYDKDPDYHLQFVSSGLKQGGVADESCDKSGCGPRPECIGQRIARTPNQGEVNLT